MDTVSGELSARAAELRSLADELSPARTLAGAGERARSTVATVSIVGTAVTAFGLLGADRVAARGSAGILLVTGSVVLAVLAVLLALSYLTLRVRTVQRRNLAEVERWRDRELQRVHLVSWSGRLLVAAVALAGAAGAIGLAADRSRAVAAVELTDGAKRAAVVSVSVSGAQPGRDVRVRATAESAHRAARTLLASALVVDAAGSAGLRSTITDIGDVSAVHVEVVVGDRVVATARADLTQEP